MSKDERLTNYKWIRNRLDTFKAFYKSKKKKRNKKKIKFLKDEKKRQKTV